MCKYLVKTYSKLLPILDSGGGSPMHDTGLGGNIKFLELLCSQNFEVQTRSNDDKTILHCACLNGRVNLCRFIIKKFPSLLEIKDKNWLSVIHEAAWSGNVELFKFLIKERKRTLYLKTTEGRTVLH